jgi:hypothetical protein
MMKGGVPYLCITRFSVGYYCEERERRSNLSGSRKISWIVSLLSLLAMIYRRKCYAGLKGLPP